MSRNATLHRHDNPLSDQLPSYRSLLEEQWRRQVANIIEVSYEALSKGPNSSTDEADAASLRTTARLIAAARQQLEETEAALRRVDDGSYARCGSCGEAITAERLEILPAARYCVACDAGRTQ